MSKNKIEPKLQSYQSDGKKRKLYRIIFQATTPAGKAFDLFLLLLIILSVCLVTLESVAGLNLVDENVINIAEWSITILFTIEYFLRIWCVRHKLKYVISFYGIIDLVSILPAYLGIWFSGTQSLIVIRAFRLLRVFRILKLSRFLGEAQVLRSAVKASFPKIIVFLGTIIIMVMIMGSVMYLIEGPENGFTSIPKGMYWAIVTMTTVGYGDISPQTPLGQVLASILMISGYGIIAVPTGVVTAELTTINQMSARKLQCDQCHSFYFGAESNFCSTCGAQLTQKLKKN